ncbi:ISL3 family transposase [Phyllobacterium trifolii]|uniref:ISL3 family transposase n=1 Tax=Phyllobacterium trifolii TaxID=300193 RepID=UPI00406BAF13
MRTKSKWTPGPGVRVLGITLQDEGNWVVSAAAKPIGVCPDCGTRSRYRHGWHNRSLQDLPVQGQVVKIKLTLNRWQCRHRTCRRRTFVDRLPIALPYTRRTARMDEIVGLIGHSMGGRPGECLMHRLGMPVSDDTILRQLKRDALACRQADNIRVVGIDDWSWRHATRYGTIMVDLERRSVVDVLDDRSVESAKAWLQERPAIEVISRDRCGLYAQAAREGAPQARQVADRFHLVQNLRAAIKEQMSFYGHAHVRPILSEDAIVSSTAQRRRARMAHRQSRQDIFEMLHALRQQGLSYSEISRRTGYERRSIANWLTSNAPRDRSRAALNPTSPLYFEAFLVGCWKDGNRIGRHLFYDIKNRGYTGSRSNLERLLKVWRDAEKGQPDDISTEERALEPVRDPDTGHVISSVIAAALCIKPRGQLTNRQARKVDALKKGSEPFAKMRSLAMRFSGILRSRNASALDEWIDDAIETNLIAIMRFASVLRRDIDAIKNAIELLWSRPKDRSIVSRH